MKVTELDYALENKLIKRLDAFADMVTRKKRIQDVLFCVHGRTGQGKTNTSLICAHYIAWKTNREIDLFFSTQDAGEFAKKTRKKIIVIDEPSLDSLSRDQMTKVNKDFMRLLNTMRQKRHVIIVNITRFWRFPFDLVVDRSLAMINMFTREGKVPGRFHYIRQKNLERLWDTYQRQKKKDFGKLKAFGGNFPERMETVDKKTGKRWFDLMHININCKKDCTYEDYKSERDKVVESIGKTELNKTDIKNNEKLELERFFIWVLIKLFAPSLQDGAAIVRRDPRRIREYKHYGQKYGFYLENGVLYHKTGGNIDNTMVENQLKKKSLERRENKLIAT
jgi:hypothetical protein